MKHFKTYYAQTSPFGQVLLLLLTGFITYSFLSMGIALILQSYDNTIPTLSSVAFADKHPVLFMLQHFIPLQVGFLFTPGLLFLILSKDKIIKKKEARITLSIIERILLLVLALSTFLLLPLLSEMNLSILRALNVEEALIAQKEASDALLQQLLTTHSGFLFGLFTIAIITGISEEFAFRGFMFNHIFRTTRKPLLSIVITAFIFALLHFNYLQFIPLFVFGAILTMIYFITRQLWLVILLHVLNNGFNVWWLSTATFPNWMENIYLETTIPSTLLFMGLLYYFRKKLID